MSRVLLWVGAVSVAGLMTVTACTPVNHIKDHLVLAVAGCPHVGIDGVDWSQARVVDMRIRQNEFQPMVVGLARDVPYALRIRNGDDNTHRFNAPTFFRQAAVAEISVDGESRHGDAGCITGVSVPPQSTVEIRLIAAHEGRYGFANPSWLRPALFQDGKNFGTLFVD